MKRKAMRVIYSGSVLEKEIYTVADKTKDIKKAKPRLRFTTEEEREAHKEGIKSEEGSVCDMWGKRQKVIGEFVCDKFIPIAYDNGVYYATEQCGRAYMTVGEAKKYGKGKPLYGWHISDLIIYDKPKELGEFLTVDNEAVKKCEHREQTYHSFTDTGYIKNGMLCRAKDDWCIRCKTKPITRPPQSWCYVEEMRADG